MKGKNKAFTGAFAALGMFFLILDTKTCFRGAAEGIELCTKTVIPSLFPFFFLTAMMQRGQFQQICRLLRPLGKLCRIPAGSEYLLFIGMIGGYPTGAQAVKTAYQNQAISKETAERMLGFCSNGGPAFIFGMLGLLWQNPMIPWLLWAIQMASALVTGMLLPGGSNTTCSIPPKKSKDPLKTAIISMAAVCSWVILFRVLISFLNHWILWIFPENIFIILSGLLELTNGCLALHSVNSESSRFITACVICSFGGLCVYLQTVSVVQGLHCRSYFLGKSMQAILSALLSSFLSVFLWGIPICYTAIMAVILGGYLVLCRKICNIRAGKRLLHRV